MQPRPVSLSGTCLDSPCWPSWLQVAALFRSLCSYTFMTFAWKQQLPGITLAIVLISQTPYAEDSEIPTLSTKVTFYSSFDPYFLMMHIYVGPKPKELNSPIMCTP